VGLKKIPYGSVYGDIIGKFFEHLPGLAASGKHYRTYAIVSPVKSFAAGFKRYISDPSVTVSTSVNDKFAPGADTLIVFHASNPRMLNDLHEMPENLRRRTVVVSSHPRVHIENKASFLDVIEVFSPHPNLGGFLAAAINRSSNQVSQR
jgi:hypothetical protein